MPTCFAYARVSTRTQSQYGVSLTEQRSAIEAYASARGLVIRRWFEESETAFRLCRTARRFYTEHTFVLAARKHPKC